MLMRKPERIICNMYGVTTVNYDEVSELPPNVKRSNLSDSTSIVSSSTTEENRSRSSILKCFLGHDDLYDNILPPKLSDSNSSTSSSSSWSAIHLQHKRVSSYLRFVRSKHAHGNNPAQVLLQSGSVSTRNKPDYYYSLLTSKQRSNVANIGTPFDVKHDTSYVLILKTQFQRGTANV
ncbi:uncharacterized protein V1478_009778 [Vespula squamosa]|uniref:Uncharacterized protein n=1 Tax=Vespula squamosa TaxID=30214 RepID=A0ABD2AJC8_VESSQ